MFRNRHILIALTVAIACVLVAAVAYLFIVGLSSGNVYPGYSSFRTDPVGIRAFCDALGDTGNVTVRRNMEPITKIGGGKDTTLFLCGASTSKDPENVTSAIETFVADGGRLVIMFYPQGDETKNKEFEKKFEQMMKEKRKKEREKESSANKQAPVSPEAAPVSPEAEPVSPEAEPASPEAEPASPEAADDSQKDKANPPADEEDDEDRAPWDLKLVSCEDRWGFTYAYEPLPGADDDSLGEALASRLVDETRLPNTLAWHSSLYFKDPAQEWKVLYAWGNHPVVMERPWGRGSIVLASDSYLVSNEAMWKERKTAFLAWLVGPSHQVVFDETHLGTERVRGTMTLIREYGLTGLVVAAALVGLLFIWKNASSLVPKRESELTEEAGSARGKGASEALVDLLRRSVSKRDVLRVCVDEWARSASLNPRYSPAKERLARAAADLPGQALSSENEMIAAYRSICRILAEKEQHRERGS